MIYEPYSGVRTWYIVFDRPRSKRRKWWWRFADGPEGRFAHCWAFSEAGEGIQRIEPLAWGLLASYEDCTATALAEQLILNNCTALLSVTIDYRACVDWRMRGIFTCVSLLKAALGLRTVAITPFRLYKYLCRHEGCIPLKAWTPYTGG
jgi:hypothetical protein